MQFSVLSSGSKANATVITSEKGNILIDCGLSARTLEGRLRAVGVDPAGLKAILVTHEHSDHIAGLSVFSRRFKVPVFMNEGTHRAYRKIPGDRRIFHWEPLGVGYCGLIGGLEVTSFALSHDAADPVGFRVSSGGTHFAQCTDLGRVTPLVETMLRGLHAIVIEANHDEDLLLACGYPWALKQRILSTHGHLSNHTAGSLIASLMHSDLGLVVLGHLSENSNTPEVALRTVQSYLPETGTQLICASVAAPTPLLSVAGLSRASCRAESQAGAYST